MINKSSSSIQRIIPLSYKLVLRIINTSEEKQPVFLFGGNEPGPINKNPEIIDISFVQNYRSKYEEFLSAMLKDDFPPFHIYQMDYECTTDEQSEEKVTYYGPENIFSPSELKEFIPNKNELVYPFDVPHLYDIVPMSLILSRNMWMKFDILPKEKITLILTMHNLQKS